MGGSASSFFGTKMGATMGFLRRKVDVAPVLANADILFAAFSEVETDGNCTNSSVAYPTCKLTHVN